MSRTTYAAVGKIIELDATVIATSADLDPFIETASAIVDDVCASVMAADGITPFYSDARLELIERWLTAHFYAIRDPRTTDEKASTVGASFEGKAEMHFNFTRYGQQAMMLDTKGGIAGLQNITKTASRVKVGVTYMGTTGTETP